MARDEEYPIANAPEVRDAREVSDYGSMQLYRMWFGQIGTTLKCGQYIPSYEWGGDDVTDREEWWDVVKRSLLELREQDPDEYDEIVERLKLERQKRGKKPSRHAPLSRRY